MVPESAAGLGGGLRVFYNLGDNFLAAVYLTLWDAGADFEGSIIWEVQVMWAYNLNLHPE